MKKLLILAMMALFVAWCYGLVFSAGTTSNTHFRGDPNHKTYDPHTRLYECRLDSGIAWGTAADSNQIIATWSTDWIHLGANRIGFMYYFRATRIDTTLTINDNDSIWISVEACANPDSWSPKTVTLHAFDPVNDTATCAKYFPPCSATVQAQTGWVRTGIVYHAWQDSLDHGSICDTLSHVPILFEETIVPVD